ncbi:nucleotide exchange factor GrpE [Oceanobacillus halophilus]|uniref:nucleotide exchange factor GrpE n=1 Tax=Oceanobacillus halophilus TaxID=930130 RepID=UPI001F4DEADD|nr:nucleotide exchange factor GrpE [Oceanobacillus halophilus]
MLENNNETVNEEVLEDKENEQEVVDKNEAINEENVDSTDADADALKESEEKIQSLQKEKDETYQRLVRLQAEFDNYKKRTLKEREADRKYKSQDLVNELLPAIDNFERALQVEVTDETKNLFDGITMVYRQLLDALQSQGVEIIESEGKEFDPNIHHAVMQVEDESIDSNTVVEELQKGYMLKDRVIRPSMVKVNK